MENNLPDSMQAGEDLLSMVTIVSLGETVLFTVVAVLFAYFYKTKVSREDFWVLVWLVYDVLVHLFLVSQL